MMYIEGGSGSTTMTVGAGAQLVAAPQFCQQTSDGLTCPFTRWTSSMVALIAADDCNCITCDSFGVVQAYKKALAPPRFHRTFPAKVFALYKPAHAMEARPEQTRPVSAIP